LNNEEQKFYIDINLFQLILEYKRHEEQIMENKANFHHMRIFALKFHDIYPDLFVTGGWDDTVRVIFKKYSNKKILNLEILLEIQLCSKYKYGYIDRKYSKYKIYLLS
jgi:hypothetical protein